MKRKRKRTVKMKKDDAKNLMFYQWISESWLISGGLITQATAARMLNKTTGRITQMIREGKLIEHKFNNEISFVRFPQIMDIARAEMYKTVIKETQKEAKKIPDIKGKKEFIKGITDILSGSQELISSDNPEMIAEKLSKMFEPSSRASKKTASKKSKI